MSLQALTLSRSDTTTSVGDIVNLMSVDCQRIQDSLFYTYYVVSFLIAIVCVVYLLWTTMGMYCSPCLTKREAYVSFVRQKRNKMNHVHG